MVEGVVPHTSPPAAAPTAPPGSRKGWAARTGHSSVRKGGSHYPHYRRHFLLQTLSSGSLRVLFPAAACECRTSPRNCSSKEQCPWCHQTPNCSASRPLPLRPSHCQMSSKSSVLILHGSPFPLDRKPYPTEKKIHLDSSFLFFLLRTAK